MTVTVRRRGHVLALAVVFVMLAGGSWWWSAYEAQKVGRHFCEVIESIVTPRIPKPTPGESEAREHQYDVQQNLIKLGHSLECY